MTFLPWTDAHRCHVDGLDSDHQALFEAVNTLHGAAAAGDGDAVLHCLDGLAVRADEHFEVEEALMERSDYPHAAAHTAEHGAFLRLVQAIRRLIADRPGSVDLAKVAGCLRTGIENHVLRSDAVLVAYFNGGGCSVAGGDRVAPDEPSGDRAPAPLVAVTVQVPADQILAIRHCARLFRQADTAATRLAAVADPRAAMTLDDAARLVATALR